MPITTLNSQAIPADVIQSSDLDYPLTDFSSTGIDDNATSTAITIDASENVNIGAVGTTTLTTLTGPFNGDVVKMDGSSGVSDRHLIFSNSSNSQQWDIDAEGGASSLGVLSFSTNSTERLRIDSSGNVGIGGSPVSSTRRLMVKDTGDVRVDIRSGADTNLGAIDFSDTSNTARGQLIYDHNDDSMQFKTLSTERMRISSAGNVGIAGAPQSFGAGVATLQLKGLSAGQATRAGALRFISNDGTSCNNAIYSDNGFMSFYTGTSTSSPERMRIDSTGDVAIGTSSAVTRLTVNAGSSPSAQYGIAGFFASSGVDSYITINRGGNDQGGIKILRGSVSDLRIYVNAAESSIINYNGGDTNDGLFFRAGSAETDVMTLDSSGNVGIGTTSPSEKLEVSGSGATRAKVTSTGSSVQFIGSAASGGMYIDSVGAADNIIFRNTGSFTERMRILSTGGITFNGDTATANALDDYEEGTFSVYLYDASSGGNQAVNGANAYYTKIGRLVMVNFYGYNNIDTTGMTSTNVAYFNLPFTVGTNGRAVGSLNHHGWTYAGNTSYQNIMPRASQNNSRGYFAVNGYGLADANVVVSDISSGADDIVDFTLIYWTDS